MFFFSILYKCNVLIASQIRKMQCKLQNDIFYFIEWLYFNGEVVTIQTDT